MTLQIRRNFHRNRKTPNSQWSKILCKVKVPRRRRNIRIQKFQKPLTWGLKFFRFPLRVLLIKSIIFSYFICVKN